MKLKELYRDLRQVFKKHIRPDVDKDPTEVQLIKMIVKLQKQQKDINAIRDGVGESARLLNNSEVFKEFEKLQKLAPSEDNTERLRTNANEDPMFL